jgi:hypothetical protein
VSDTTSDGADCRVEKIDAAVHDLLRAAMDRSAPPQRQIATWYRILKLADEQSQLLELDHHIRSALPPGGG